MWNKLIKLLGEILLFGPPITGIIIGLYILIFPLTSFSILCTLTVISMIMGFLICLKTGVLDEK